jgi:hypothetical protein
VQKQETAKKAAQSLKASIKPTVKTAENYDPNPYTKEKIDAFYGKLNKGETAADKFGRAYVGASQGIVNAGLGTANFVGSKLTGKDINLQERTGLNVDHEELRANPKFKGWETAGEVAGYMMQGAACIPTFVAILPKSRYGQFCSAQAIFNSVLLIVANWGGGLFIDLTGNYRNLYLWDAFFTTLALLAMIVVWIGWKKFGGIKNYIAP